MWPFRKRHKPVLVPIGNLLQVDPFPHIERKIHLDAGPDLFRATFYNRRTREFFTEEFTLTDCYEQKWIAKPMFGGPGRWVRVLNDTKVEEKMKLVFGTRMKQLGWV